MASLTLTDDEKKLSSLMDFSDEALGRIIKRTIAAIGSTGETTDTESLFVVTCSHALVASAININATESSIKIEGLFDGDKELGDWEILIKKTDNKALMPDQN